MADNVSLGESGHIAQVSNRTIGYQRLYRFAVSTELPINRRSQRVPELYLLGFEIFLVVRVRLGPNRDLLDHFQTVTFQADHFFRIIGQEPELSHAEIEKNLRAQSIIAQVRWQTEFRVRLDRV